MFKFPKNDAKYFWTQHVLRKMVYYGLTPDRVKRLIRNPKRVEDGIASNTIAVMSAPPGRDLAFGRQPKNKKPKGEVWAMYQTKPKSKQKIVISAWRYPGVSPIGKQIPIPKDILEELKNEGIID